LFYRLVWDPARGADDLPWLVFLQGGPGGAGPRPTGGPAWLAEAVRLPVTEPPGTYFQYGSVASFLLSALVGRVVGVNLHAYLRERIFGPLRITGEQWDADPAGITSGGNGLLVKPEDVAKLGLLHLNGGIWDGRQLLPPEWVREATSAQVVFPPERRDEYTYEPHATGYGYHWWIGPAGAYYASGVFGQYCAVLPESRAVIVVNAGAQLAEAHLMLDRVWKNREVLHAGTPTGNGSGRALTVTLPRDEVVPPDVTALIQSGEHRVYRVEPNPDGITSIRLRFDESMVAVELVDHGHTATISAGFGEWIDGRTSLPGASLHHEYDMPDAPVACAARWVTRETLSITCVFTETAFVDTLTFRFRPESLCYDRSVNTNSAARQRPTVVATLVNTAANLP
jgi:hypothetical protein